MRTILFFFLAVMLSVTACQQGENSTSTSNLSTAKVDTTEMVAIMDTSSLRNTAILDTLSQDTFAYTINEDGYIELDWKMLSKVSFEERFSEEMGAYVPYPIFSYAIQQLAGRKVEIKGYVIPVEETGDETLIVLSAYPYSQCFFCGMAGPESIMDIKLRNKLSGRQLSQDQREAFRGKLRLNDTDLYYLNYILEDATLKR